MNKGVKDIIDIMSYENMLRLVRFAPSGNRYFMGDTGEYFSKVMKEKEDKLPDGERVAISKRVGWDELE